MSQPNSERKSQKQENIVRDSTVGGDLTFAPQQIDTYIETQIVEISAEKVTQQPLIKASPYKGLKRFNFSDHEYFFGRDALIAKLFNAVNESRFSLVLGASGSGKSSVVRAGLIPELKKSLESQKFYNFVFTPNQDPFESLHRCLLNEEKDYKFTESEAKVALEAKPDTISQLISTLKKEEEKWFLFIDQFEQLFTICTDTEKRKNFIEGIVQVAKKGDNSVRIVLAMRSDFLEQFSFYPTLGAIANQNNIHLVTEMYPDELRQAIEQPAAKHGVVFETGLVEQIIIEVKGQSGYLPLLQYTLDLLWEKECTTKASDSRFHIEDRTLNKTNYVALEGVRGALKNRVNEIYEDICKKNENGELVTKQIFLKLVNISESDSGSRAVSRRAYRYEFVGEPIESTLKRFIDEKLLVSDYEYLSREELLLKDSKKTRQNATIEIAHEILLSSWDKLKRWLEEEKEAIILKNWLANETKRWLEVWAEDESKANDELLKGSRLDQIVEFREKNAFEKLGGLVREENEFIDASVEWQKLEKEKEERAREETTRLQRRAIKWLSGGLIVALIAGGFAVWQLRQAQIGQIEALSTSSKTLFSTDPIDSLIDGLKAAKKLKQTFGANADIEAKVRLALIQAVYSIRENNRLENHKGNVNDISFSSDNDNKYLASVGGDGTLRFWNLEGKETKVWWGNNTRILKMSFSPNGELIALADENNTISLWSISGEKIIEKFKTNDKQITSLIFSPDGEIIASGNSDGSIKLWDVKGKKIITIKGHESRVNSIKFSPDGEIIASGSSDGSIKLWNLNGQEIRTLKEDNKQVSQVNSIDFSSDGTLIASGSQDGLLRLWGREGKFIRTVPQNNSALNKSSSGISSIKVKVIPSGLAIAIGYDNGIVKFWSGGELTTIGKHKSKVNSIKFSNDGKLVASASDDGTLKLWNLDRPRPYNLEPYQGDVGLSNLLSFSPDGKMIVTAAIQPSLNKHIVRFWKIGSVRDTFLSTGENVVRSLHFHPKGKKVAIALNSGVIKIINLKGQEIAVLNKYESPVNTLKFSPCGKTIVFGSDNGTVKLWNFSSQEIYILGKHNESTVQSVAFSPDGKIIASGGGGDSIIKIWDLKGQELYTLKGHVGAVKSISFDPDGKIIASGGSDGIIKLWNSKGQEIDTLWGHSTSIDSISFSPDRRMLVSSGGGRVNLWLFNNSTPITLVDNRWSKNMAEFSLDGKKLASSIGDTGINLWNLEIDDLQSQSCYLIRDYLKNNPNLGKQERQLCKGVKDSAHILFQQGIKLAKRGNLNSVEEAITKFQKASKINPYLNIEPKKEAVYISARTYFNLAGHSFFSQDYEKGNRFLRIATGLELKIGTLEFNPKKRARDLATRAVIEEGGVLAVMEKSGNIYKTKIDQRMLFPTAYHICWIGSLHGYASQSLDACNKIVDLEPEPGRFRGIRGTAKAMSGDLKGAVEDFEANIIWLNSDRTKTKYTQKSLNRLKQIRQNWIDELRIGNNPLKSLTPKEIEKMSQITPK